ncbi:MAG: hypothetical protein QG641_2410, partial [Candidatus Poribacteria bacterium]|nr:hypothetical protein [Candidatus Poribacteria bacterium]
DFVACSIEDVISDVDEVAVVLPPIENKTIFPFPRLESTSDRDRRYEIFYYLIEQTGIKEGSSFVVLTDSIHSYFCGEIVNNLLFYKYPTSMIFVRDHSVDEIRNLINKLSPDCLLIGINSMLDYNWEIPYIFTVNQFTHPRTPLKSNTPPDPSQEGRLDGSTLERGSRGVIHFNIYAISEIGWIAIGTSDGSYIYPEDYFYIETDPADDILVLTTLANDLQPFIRYKTSDRAKILDGNCFQITYIGEH